MSVLNTCKIFFFKVAIAKIITCQKNLEKPKFCYFSTLGRHRKKFDLHKETAKYNNFLGYPFLILGLVKYPRYLLISLCLFLCCFFAAAILPPLVSLLHSLLKGKEKEKFLRSLVWYKVRLAPFHIELKAGGWQHFYSSLPSSYTDLQAHLEQDGFFSYTFQLFSR